MPRSRHADVTAWLALLLALVAGACALATPPDGADRGSGIDAGRRTHRPALRW